VPDAAAALIDQLRAALTLPGFDVQAAYRRMSPSSRPLTVDLAQARPRAAAVMIVLYPDHAGEWSFPLIHRASYPGVHSDQIALPGGRLESDELAAQAAERETCEEIGLCDGITLIGALNPLYVPPSNYLITPFVGVYNSYPVWQPDPREVAGVLEIPLNKLFEADLKRVDSYEAGPGRTFERPYYWLDGQIVWGATAIILSEFEHRLRAVEYLK